MKDGMWNASPAKMRFPDTTLLLILLLFMLPLLLLSQGKGKEGWWHLGMHFWMQVACMHHEKYRILERKRNFVGCQEFRYNYNRRKCWKKLMLQPNSSIMNYASIYIIMDSQYQYIPLGFNMILSYFIISSIYPICHPFPTLWGRPWHNKHVGYYNVKFTLANIYYEECKSL